MIFRVERPQCGRAFQRNASSRLSSLSTTFRRRWPNRRLGSGRGLLTQLTEAQIFASCSPMLALRPVYLDQSADVAQRR